MDKLISELEEMSEGLISRLDRVSYEELSNFVEQRQRVIDEISSHLKIESMNNDIKGRINSVLQSDAQIRRRMEVLRDEASDWLQQREQAKVQRSAYESAYSADSILMDRKK